MTSIVMTTKFQMNLEELVDKAVTSVELSTEYVKKLTKVILLNILNKRFSLDKAELLEKKLLGVPYVYYRKKAKSGHIKRYQGWINGIEEAIDKGYLKNIFLQIEEMASNKVLEEYAILLRYNPGQVSSKDRKTKRELRLMTLSLLRAINKLNKMPVLGDNVTTNLMIAYTDNTPLDYEPRNFVPFGEFDKKVIKNWAVLGRVSTGYHSISCKYDKNDNAEKNVEDNTEIENGSVVSIILNSFDSEKPSPFTQKSSTNTQSLSDILNPDLLSGTSNQLSQYSNSDSLTKLQITPSSSIPSVLVQSPKTGMKQVSISREKSFVGKAPSPNDDASFRSPQNFFPEMEQDYFDSNTFL